MSSDEAKTGDEVESDPEDDAELAEAIRMSEATDLPHIEPWHCTTCTYLNHKHNNFCEVCATEKDTNPEDIMEATRLGRLTSNEDEVNGSTPDVEFDEDEQKRPADITAAAHTTELLKQLPPKIGQFLQQCLENQQFGEQVMSELVMNSFDEMSDSKFKTFLEEASVDPERLVQLLASTPSISGADVDPSMIPQHQNVIEIHSESQLSESEVAYGAAEIQRRRGQLMISNGNAEAKSLSESESDEDMPTLQSEESDESMPDLQNTDRSMPEFGVGYRTDEEDASGDEEEEEESETDGDEENDNGTGDADEDEDGAGDEDGIGADRGDDTDPDDADEEIPRLTSDSSDNNSDEDSDDSSQDNSSPFEKMSNGSIPNEFKHNNSKPKNNKSKEPHEPRNDRHESKAPRKTPLESSNASKRHQKQQPKSLPDLKNSDEDENFNFQEPSNGNFQEKPKREKRKHRTGSYLTWDYEKNRPRVCEATWSEEVFIKATNELEDTTKQCTNAPTRLCRRCVKEMTFYCSSKCEKLDRDNHREDCAHKLNARLNKSEADTKKLQQQVEDYLQRLSKEEQVHVSLQKLEKERDKLEEKLDRATIAISEKTDAIHKLEVDLKTTKDLLKDVDFDNVEAPQLRSQLEKANEERKKALSRSKKYERKFEESDRKLQRCKRQIEGINKDRDNLKELNKAMKRKSKQFPKLEIKHEKLQLQCANIREEHRNLVEETKGFPALQLQHEELESQHKKLSDVHQKLSIAHRTLMKEVHEFSKVQNRNRYLESQCDKVIADYRKVKADNRNLVREAEDFQAIKIRVLETKNDYAMLAGERAEVMTDAQLVQYRAKCRKSVELMSSELNNRRKCRHCHGTADDRSLLALLLPCKHQVVCKTCAASIARCPVCDAHVDDYICPTRG